MKYEIVLEMNACNKQLLACYLAICVESGRQTV